MRLDCAEFTRGAVHGHARIAAAAALQLPGMDWWYPPGVCQL